MTSTRSDLRGSWLGSLPEEWNVLQPRRLFRLRRQPERPDDVHLTPSQRFGVLAQAKYMELTGNRVVLNLSGTAMQHVEAGDFISHLRTFQGGLELARTAGKVSPAYTVVAPRPEVEPEFFKYVLKSRGYVSQIASLTDQLRDGQTMRFTEFNRTSLPVPPLSEQRAIADYLDHETAEIDTFLADTQAFAQLATERSTTRYATWLTNGTSQNPKLTKDHDVGWLQGAAIPEHWETVKLGLTAQLRSGNGIPATDIEPSGEYPVYGGGGLRGYTSSWTHRENQVMFGRQGALCGQVFLGHGPLFATEHAVVVRPVGSLDLKWLESLLRFMNLGQYSTSAAQPGLSVDDISKLKIIRPPLKEQQSIARSIARDQRTMTSMHQDFEAATNLARERRAALISAAVTGQIDVTKRRKPVAEQLEDEVLQKV